LSFSRRSDEQKNTAEWQARFDEYLNAIENLQPSTGSSTDLIWEKCLSYGSAALVAPTGSRRERVLSRYVGLLNISNIEPEALPEWYSQVQGLLELVRSIYGDQESLLKVFAVSGNRTLALLAELHKLEKTSP